MFDQSAKHFRCRSVKHFSGLSNIGGGLSNIFQVCQTSVGVCQTFFRSDKHRWRSVKHFLQVCQTFLGQISKLKPAGESAAALLADYQLDNLSVQVCAQIRKPKICYFLESSSVTPGKRPRAREKSGDKRAVECTHTDDYEQQP